MSDNNSTKGKREETDIHCNILTVYSKWYLILFESKM